MFYFKKLKPLTGGLFISAVFIANFLFTAFWFPAFCRIKLALWTHWVLGVFGGFYLFLGLGAVLVLLMISISPIGGRRLGAEKPEYSWWFISFTI